jgi:ubiquitin
MKTAATTISYPEFDADAFILVLEFILSRGSDQSISRMNESKIIKEIATVADYLGELSLYELATENLKRQELQNRRRSIPDICENNALIVNGPYQIFVKNLTGKTFTLTVKSSDTIEQVTAKIQEIDSASPIESKLIQFLGKTLEAGYTLGYYHIQKEVILSLGLKLDNDTEEEEKFGVHSDCGLVNEMEADKKQKFVVLEELNDEEIDFLKCDSVSFKLSILY